MRRSTPAVLIAGAGPVGLTLANDLVRRDVPVRIVERLAATSTRAKAHGLQGRTIEMLDMLGLATSMVAAAQRPAPTIAFKVGDREIRLPPSLPHEPYPLAVPVMQQTIEEILEASLEARGVSVERSTTVSGFTMDDGGVTVELQRRDGSTEDARADWLVACDGAHSVIRKQLGLAMEGETIGEESYWLTECDISWDRPRDVWTTFINDAGLAAAIWVELTGKWHVFVSRLGAGEAAPDLDQFDRMAKLFCDVTGMADARLENPEWVSTLKVNQRMPSQYVVGRAVLAGDAAHAHTAAGGQGMNTGIQDALNLGWKLALVTHGVADRSLVETYEAERLPNARQLLKDTKQYHAIMFPRTRLRRAMTSTVFRSLARFTFLQRAQTHRIGMFNQHVRPSPLSREHGGGRRRAVRAGDYLPHAPCRLGGVGGSIRDLLRQPQAVVLVHLDDAADAGQVRAIDSSVHRLASHVRVHYVFSSEARAARAAVQPDDPRAIIDGSGQVRQALGLRSPEIVYVRPDGYIGLRAPTLDPLVLRSYLATIYEPSLIDDREAVADTATLDVAS